MVYGLLHEVSISEGFIEFIGPQLSGDHVFVLYDTRESKMYGVGEQCN